MQPKQSNSSVSLSMPGIRDDDHNNNPIYHDEIENLSIFDVPQSSTQQVKQNKFLSFCGPFRPLFGGHTDVEASTSVCLPTLVVLIMRVIFGLALLTEFLFYSVAGHYLAVFFSIWAHVLLIVSFMATAMTTLTFMMVKGPGERAHKSILASIVVPLHQTAVSCQLLSTIIIASMNFLGNFGPDAIFQHIATLIFILIDMLLTLRMQFRIIYIIFTEIFALIYIIYISIRYRVNGDFVFPVLNESSSGKIFGLFIAALLIAFVAGLIMIAISRLSRLSCCGPQIVVQDGGYGWNIFDDDITFGAVLSDSAHKNNSVVSTRI